MANGGCRMNRSDICDDRTFAQLCSIFRAHGVTKAVVFGSFARGDQTKRSDLDLMLIQNTDKSFFKRYDGLYEEICRILTNYAVDLLIYTKHELDQMAPRTFIQSILREGVAIYEPATAAS